MVFYKGEIVEMQAECAHWTELASKADPYQAILCDIWGVLHNGVNAYTDAAFALTAFRKQGGNVILLSNAPRPATIIRPQLEALGITTESFDHILTSGDLTRSALNSQAYGKNCFHLGPPRDLGLFDDAKTQITTAENADFILCTGFEDDEIQTPEHYRAFLEKAVLQNQTLICANPDKFVERDGRLIPCAGLLATFYETLGGKSVYFGKPHPPIYESAMELLGNIPSHKILAIGDGLQTDILGAVNQNMDTLFILAGIAKNIAHKTQNIQQACRKEGVTPTAWMSQLRW